MVVQDDNRENELIGLFKLKRPDDSSRGGMDAILPLGGMDIPFELKSTSTGSVTTVRDFGYEHIKKWEGKHWLIGFYAPGGSRLLFSHYGSPKMMAKWIKEKAEYIRPDFEIGKHLPEKITMDIMHHILGEEEEYTYGDAVKLHKKQYTKEKYEERMDRKNGYSPKRMLEILIERSEYLINRGSTLNNPHIPASYFRGWSGITGNHASELRKRVRYALANDKPSDFAIL